MQIYPLGVLVTQFQCVGEALPTSPAGCPATPLNCGITYLEREPQTPQVQDSVLQDWGSLQVPIGSLEVVIWASG